MKITYGLADYDRYTGSMDWDWKLPMEGVAGGGFREFMESAGENGWELCSSFASGTVGNNRALPGTVQLRKTEHASEVTTFIFKKV